MSEQMAFDELHDDLFKLFTLAFSNIYVINKAHLNYLCTEQSRLNILDLFPREIHQERVEYSGYISDYGKMAIKKRVLGFEVVGTENFHFIHKIKFYYIDDNKQEG